MSLELTASKIEVLDEDGGLILDHNTRLIPAVQKVALTNIDVAFPDVSKGVSSIMNTGTKGTSSQSPSNRSWRSYAWGLTITAGVQQGAIDLATITSGLAPTLLLGNVRAFRSVNPRENVFGPFTKSLLENVDQPMRSGARLEFTAWCRRIVWFDIAGGKLRLNWKQSTRAYDPNQLDPEVASSWPTRWRQLDAPPAYQIGSSYEEAPAESGTLPGSPGGVFPPNTKPTPAVNSGPGGAISFASTWRFSKINIWLCQV